jgi:hypothetical protein
MRGFGGMLWIVGAALGLAATPVPAQAQTQGQMTTIDPNTAIDSDLNTPAPVQDIPTPEDEGAFQEAPRAEAPAPPAVQQQAPGEAMDAREVNTFRREELVGAAEEVFGKGASGLAGLLEDILKDQGEPNAYIGGSEAAGAIGVGLRYGSGRMFHKVEGERKVYWTGPSIGFDVGGDANKVFVLVYNLYDSQDLYKRFPAGEGRAYFVGGFSASYMRRGDIVLIPVRLGVGWRLGVNAGYMKFSEKRRILPF